MTRITSTSDHLVEYEPGARMLTITRRTDGRCLAMTGPRIAGDFRDCLDTHAPERVIQTFTRLATAQGIDWTPMYKSGAHVPA